MNRSIFAGLLSCILLASCSHIKAPAHKVADKPFPAAPDYSLSQNWAALPEMADFADETPLPNLENRQATASADVFYIHPTTYRGDDSWNADLTDAKVNKWTDEFPLKHQGSIFNGSCKVYAPRYRQVTFGAFFSNDRQSQLGALALAYDDVKQSFDYYLENYNQGRPIVIASHSQGTLHAIRLIQEYFDGKPLGQQLVTAYLPGWPVMADTFKVLKPCNEPGQTGCYASWNTYLWDFTPELAQRYENAVVTNPLNWKSDGTYASHPCSKGMVLKKYNKVFDNVCDAQAHEGVLWIHKPDVPGAMFLKMQNFHIADYNLFWMDIRENVDLQVKNFSNLSHSQLK